MEGLKDQRVSLDPQHWLIYQKKSSTAGNCCRSSGSRLVLVRRGRFEFVIRFEPFCLKEAEAAITAVDVFRN